MDELIQNNIGSLLKYDNLYITRNNNETEYYVKDILKTIKPLNATDKIDYLLTKIFKEQAHIYDDCKCITHYGDMFTNFKTAISLINPKYYPDINEGINLANEIHNMCIKLHKDYYRLRGRLGLFDGIRYVEPIDDIKNIYTISTNYRIKRYLCKKMDRLKVINFGLYSPAGIILILMQSEQYANKFGKIIYKLQPNITKFNYTKYIVKLNKIKEEVKYNLKIIKEYHNILDNITNSINSITI